MNKTDVLSEVVVEQFVSENPPWLFRDNKLEASFEFADFEDAMKVVNEVAGKAEELQHHPFWSNEYNKLAFSLCTHDVGDKVTEKDLELAKAISGIVSA